jgi:hypothetical protein
MSIQQLTGSAFSTSFSVQHNWMSIQQLIGSAFPEK